MKTVIQNLQYIEKSIQNETYKQQRAILDLMLVETIEAVRENTFVYEVPYSSEKANAHYRIFINRSRKAKALLISNIQELQLILKRDNTRRCLAIIKGMLESQLYQDKVYKVINNWKNTTTFPTKYKQIYVK